jgi:hypothetical protein
MALRTLFACGLAMLFAVLVGISAYQSVHRTPVCGVVGEPPEEVRKFASDIAERHDYLCSFDGTAMTRIGKRKEIIGELAAGRMTLFEAAARFKRLNSEPTPGNLDVLRTFRGATDNERLCRQVITWLDSTTHSMTESQRQQVLGQAEAELRKHIAQHGGQVVLPEI